MTLSTLPLNPQVQFVGCRLVVEEHVPTPTDDGFKVEPAGVVVSFPEAQFVTNEQVGGVNPVLTIELAIGLVNVKDPDSHALRVATRSLCGDLRSRGWSR